MAAANNISTPDKITAKSDSFAASVEAKRADSETENGNAAGGNEGKSGRALPKLGGENDDQITKAGFSFDQVREKVATLLHSLGLGGGDTTAKQNLETTEVGRVMAGGASNAATVAATAHNVGVEAPQQSLSKLSPDILALAKEHAKPAQEVGMIRSVSDNLAFAGTKAPETPGATTALG